MVAIMKNLYQIPSKHRTKPERLAFWNKVIIDQSDSGMNMQEFCRLHQIQYSTFKRYKYGMQNANNFSRKANQSNNLKSMQKNNNTAKFVPLQITANTEANAYPKDEITDSKITEVKIVLSNGHEVILPLIISEASLLWLIKIVAGLQC
jgi:hypothetical protein